MCSLLLLYKFFSRYYIIANLILLGFGLLIEEDETFTDITLLNYDGYLSSYFNIFNKKKF